LTARHAGSNRGDAVAEADGRVFAVLVGAGAGKRAAVRAEHGDRGASQRLA
jgi:hypothetical protein